MNTEGLKKKANVFLEHLQSTMDHEISIRCRIYKLEETHIQPGESPDELVDRLRTLADCCNFPSEEEKEWNIQYRLVRALDDRDLVKKLLTLPIMETTAKMLEVCRTHIAINGEMEAMGLGGSKTVHAIQKGPTWKGPTRRWHKPQQQQQPQQQHSCGNCTVQQFTKEWNIDHELSSPCNPRSNGQAESAVKIVKGLLTRAKYSGQDPYLALLAYRSTPVDSHLRSPAEMLYRCTIRTTVPQRIRNKDPHANLDMEQLNNQATQSTSYHDCHSRIKSPFYAGQTVSVLNDAKTLWLPATILRQADHGSYLIKVVGGGTY